VAASLSDLDQSSCVFLSDSGCVPLLACAGPPAGCVVGGNLPEFTSLATTAHEEKPTTSVTERPLTLPPNVCRSVWLFAKPSSARRGVRAAVQSRETGNGVSVPQRTGAVWRELDTPPAHAEAPVRRAGALAKHPNVKAWTGVLAMACRHTPHTESRRSLLCGGGTERTKRYRPLAGSREQAGLTEVAQRGLSKRAESSQVQRGNPPEAASGKQHLRPSPPGGARRGGGSGTSSPRTAGRAEQRRNLRLPASPPRWSALSETNRDRHALEEQQRRRGRGRPAAQQRQARRERPAQRALCRARKNPAPPPPLVFSFSPRPAAGSCTSSSRACASPTCGGLKRCSTGSLRGGGGLGSGRKLRGPLCRSFGKGCSDTAAVLSELFSARCSQTQKGHLPPRARAKTLESFSSAAPHPESSLHTSAALSEGLARRWRASLRLCVLGGASAVELSCAGARGAAVQTNRWLGMQKSAHPGERTLRVFPSYVRARSVPSGA